MHSVQGKTIIGKPDDDDDCSSAKKLKFILIFKYLFFVETGFSQCVNQLGPTGAP